MFVKNKLLPLFRTAIDLFYPPRCLLCKSNITVSNCCAKCWGELTFIRGTICHKCGIPLIFETQEHKCQTFCIQSRFILEYNEKSKPLFLSLKYYDMMHFADFFAHWTLNILPPKNSFWHNVNHIIPVPLHWTRLLKRQYNQSTLIAKAIQKRMPHLSIDFNILKRVKKTVSQGKTSQELRKKNLCNAFSVKKNPNISGILLIDDIFASGATIKECIKTLGVPVKVLCIGKVLKNKNFI